MSRRGDRPARRTVGVAVAAVAVVVIALVAVFAVVVLRRDRGEGSAEAFCAALNAKVAGLDRITWDDGVGQSGSSWFAVLGDGIDHADIPSRAAMSDAVAKDVAGYDALTAAADASTKETLDRLWAVAVSGTAPSGGRAAETSGQTANLRRLAAERCNLH